LTIRGKAWFAKLQRSLKANGSKSELRACDDGRAYGKVRTQH